MYLPHKYLTNFMCDIIMALDTSRKAPRRRYKIVGVLNSLTLTLTW